MRKMLKKLSLITSVSCIVCLIVLYVFKDIGDLKSRFIKTFDLDIDEAGFEFEELFNNYEGFPYEGMALYRLTIGEDERQSFLKWERLPFSDDAKDLLESISTYVAFPDIADGYWKMVDRNPETQAYKNVSICIYDAANGAAYLITMDS